MSKTRRCRNDAPGAVDDPQVIHGIFFAGSNPADADALICSRNVLARVFFVTQKQPARASMIR
ncbi:hypothetical protein [Paraburkholderia fungorum]|uniref:hypothetical protein n=1 Tax=Paraburkholderia fungorum TaxID=134537 RepID=UPI0011C3ED6A|nr:hypothetical protein [Paraburkholderia fungorum]